VRIVGRIDEVTEPSVYASPVLMDRLVGKPDTAGALRVVTDPAEAHAVLARIEDSLFSAGAVSGFAMSVSALRGSMVDHFAILLALLSMAATGALLVGTLGLASSVAASVLDRRREIGVLRAMGARRRTVLAILGVEVALIVISAIALSFVLAWPLTWGLTRVLGEHGLHASVPMIWSGTGVVLWPIIAASIGLAALVAAAWQSIRRPVHESLGYE
jgi:putative ABC transport system permease protein